VDGIVVDGRSAIDESMVTGESMSVTRSVDDKVNGGTLNQSGALIIRAEKVGRDTILSRIVQMVADAQRSRAPIQRMADQVSGWFVPLVIVIAFVTFVAWAMFGPVPRMTYGLIATGDNRTTALAIARRLGIDEVEADVLPDKKSAVVSRLKSKGRVVAMAGDGVNDARRWLLRMWASPWGQARMSPWKAQALRS
jgi:cation transport ATPase